MIYILIIAVLLLYIAFLHQQNKKIVSVNHTNEIKNQELE
jgi:hypothetical protein